MEIEGCPEPLERIFQKVEEESERRAQDELEKERAAEAAAAAAQTQTSTNGNPPSPPSAPPTQSDADGVREGAGAVMISLSNDPISSSTSEQSQVAQKLSLGPDAVKQLQNASSPANSLRARKERRRGSVSISRVGILPTMEEDQSKSTQSLASGSPFYSTPLASVSNASIASGASAHSCEAAHSEDIHHVTQMQHIAGKPSLSSKISSGILPILPSSITSSGIISTGNIMSSKMIPRRLSRAASTRALVGLGNAVGLGGGGGVGGGETSVMIGVSVEATTVTKVVVAREEGDADAEDTAGKTAGETAAVDEEAKEKAKAKGEEKSDSPTIAPAPTPNVPDSVELSHSNPNLTKPLVYTRRASVVAPLALKSKRSTGSLLSMAVPKTPKEKEVKEKERGVKEKKSREGLFSGKEKKKQEKLSKKERRPSAAEGSSEGWFGRLFKRKGRVVSGGAAGSSATAAALNGKAAVEALDGKVAAESVEPTAPTTASEAPKAKDANGVLPLPTATATEEESTNLATAPVEPETKTTTPTVVEGPTVKVATTEPVVAEAATEPTTTTETTTEPASVARPPSVVEPSSVTGAKPPNEAVTTPIEPAAVADHDLELVAKFDCEVPTEVVPTAGAALTGATVAVVTPVAVA